MIPDLVHDDLSFPVAPPPDLDDPAVIAAHDWDAFLGLDRMKDHWDRSRWHPGYRAYYWMLTFPQSPELLKLARRCQDALAPLGMDDIPDDGLHITMTKIGDTTCVENDALDQLARLIKERLPVPFRVTAHPLTGSQGAARLTVTPWRQLLALHSALTLTNAEAGVPGGRPTSGFRPHLGVAYNNRDRAADEVVPLIAPLRGLAPVDLVIKSVQLVELRREGAAYRWDIVHSVALPGAGENVHLL